MIILGRSGGAARGTQKEPGAARRSRQEEPVGARGSQEQLGPARRRQEQAGGGARGSQEEPGGHYGFEGAAKGSQEEAGAARRGRRSQRGLEQPVPAKWPGGVKYLQMSILNYKSARFPKGI